LDGTNSPAVACHHAATDDVATAIVVVVVVRVGIVFVVVGSKAKPCKRASVKSAVKSSVKSSTVEPTASEAAMKATAVEAASAKAAAVTATTLVAFGVRTQGVERLRDGHQICWAHVGRSSDGANILIGQQVVAGLRGSSPWLEQQFD